MPHPTTARGLIFESNMAEARLDLVGSTVEPRLSRFLDYPDFFCGANLVMNIY